MLAIVAALVALAPTSDARAQDVAAPPAQTIFATNRPTPLCKGAGRLQTGYEPALLFREEDRDAARLRKLIEMPMGEMCRLGASR
jgi:hypothetical protein